MDIKIQIMQNIKINASQCINNTDCSDHFVCNDRSIIDGEWHPPMPNSDRYDHKLQMLVSH